MLGIFQRIEEIESHEQSTAAEQLVATHRRHFRRDTRIGVLQMSLLCSGMASSIFILALVVCAPKAAQAKGCVVTEIGSFTSTESLRDLAQANFECLSQKLNDLKAQQEQLRDQLETLERQKVPARSIVAYLNSNGKITNDEREVGPATFVLAGDKRGAPTSLKLDYSLLAAMCGDADGCLVTLGLEGLVINGKQEETRFTRGPCDFYIGEKFGTWALTGTCATNDLPVAGSRKQPGVVAPNWGRDGDAMPLGGSDQDGRVILGFGGACFFTESPPERRSNIQPRARLQRDVNRDLYLVAGGSRWNFNGKFPGGLLSSSLSDPPFHCRLTFRD